MIDALGRRGRGCVLAGLAEDQNLKEERCCHVSDEIDARFRYFAVPVPGTVKDRRRRRLELVA